METSNLDQVEDVDIDTSGKFKYVLIKLYHPDSEEDYKYIVRGYKWAGFHGKLAMFMSDNRVILVVVPPLGLALS